MSSCSRARRRAAARIVLVGLGLLLAALACRPPDRVNDASSMASGGGAYFTCATGTPVPTMEVTAWATDPIVPLATVSITITTTPVPTETPFYRVGEFYQDQAAILGPGLEITLRGIEVRDGASIVNFDVNNRSASEIRTALAAQVRAEDAGGRLWQPDLVKQLALGLPDLRTQETTMISAGASVRRQITFGTPEIRRVSINSGVLSGSADRPVWFNPFPDPAYDTGACAHGPADWRAYDPTQIGFVGDTPGLGVLPPPAPPGQWPSRPSIAGGHYPINAPFYFASKFLVGGHHGYDLTGCFWGGCKNDGPSRFIRMGGTRPIFAFLPGVVERAGCAWNGGYGCHVVVRTQLSADTTLYTYYAHLWGTGSDVWRPGVPDATCDPLDCGATTLSVLGAGPGPLVSAGQQVGCWQPLGFIGMTGRTTGPHLHWEVRIGGGSLPGPSAQFDPELTRAYQAYLCLANNDRATPPPGVE